MLWMRIWGGSNKNIKVREPFLRLQGKILNRINKRYKIISRQATLVTAGLSPIDLVTAERITRRKIKINEVNTDDSRRNGSRENYGEMADDRDREWDLLLFQDVGNRIWLKIYKGITTPLNSWVNMKINFKKTLYGKKMECTQRVSKKKM